MTNETTDGNGTEGGRTLVLRAFWQLLGEMDARLVTRVADKITVHGTTMRLLAVPAVAERLPRGPQIVNPSRYLEDETVSEAVADTFILPATVTSEQVRSWDAGHVAIPQWVARTLLHMLLEDALNEEEED